MRPVAALAVAGLAVHSRRLLALALGGAALGALVGFAFLGWYGLSDTAFVVVTAAPVFVALSGVFVAPGVRATLLALAAVVASFFVWFGAGLFLRELELPFLTLPFWVTTSAFLLVLRALG